MKDIEWLKETLEERIDTMAKFEEVSYSIGLKEAYQHTLLLINQLDEPEVLSQKWIDDNKKDSGVHYIGYYVPIGRLHDLLVPKREITKEQVVEWLDNNDFYDHITAETVLENAVDKGELGYYGTKYSVVKKEPETVADVVTTFWKSYERLKEVMSMEVEELEE